MNSRFILTQSSEKVKPDLTVPSRSSDIRLVAESSENRPVKRRGFRKTAKMARDSKADQSTRPARRIKLNRSIFNTESTAKPTIHVKTLSEIKNEKEACKDPVKPTTEVSVNCVSQNPISSVANVSSASPMPARSVVINASPSSDTRTVITRENTTPSTRLLLPTIKLRRMTKDEYKRSISNQNRSFASRVLNKETGQPNEVRGQTKPQTVFTQPPWGSPVKKRKVSPMRLKLPKAPSINVSPSKRRKISPIQSPDSMPLTSQVENGPVSPSQPPPSPPQPPPSPLDSPPSPALSLWAQSGDEVENEANMPVANSRVIIMAKPTNTETRQKSHTNPVQTNTQHDVHSRLGPPQNTHASQRNATAITFTDDCLDIMSVIAADDELFIEDKPNGLLKRSLSQDSIFSMADEHKNYSNLRSLAKKQQDNSKHLVGDLVTGKPLSGSFRIPRQNYVRDTKNNSDSISKGTTPESDVKRRSESYTSGYGRKGGDPPRNSFFRGTHQPPKPTRVVSNEGEPLNGFSVQEKMRSIHRNLGAKNIQEAWSIIKEIEDSKSDIDVRVLEETVKVCEKVSVKEATPKLAEIALGVFEVLKRRDTLKPMAYVLTALTLCRCGMFREGFDKMLEMLEARIFPPQAVLVHFVNDLLKCLRSNPKWIFELLPYIKRFNFSNPTHIFNNCLSSLLSAPVDVLREITPSQWDALISMLCVPPNAQGAMQVQNIMDKHCIPMSDQSITKLLVLYRDTKCTKQLLDLAHLKCTNETFDVGPIFADESLKLRDVEAHIVDLVKTSSLPREDVLHHFIEKASAMKEYNLIYNLFLKCEGSSVSFPVKTLKKMVDALENWDENMTASVEVYSALRDQATKTMKKKPKSAPPTSIPPQKTNKFQHGRCYSFMNTGQCNFGNWCKFSHVIDESPQFRRNSDTSSPQSVGEVRKSDDSDGKPPRNHNAKLLADFPTTSTSTTMVNGHSAQQFPSFQHPSFVVPMFNPIQNHSPALRIPKPVRHLQENSTRHPFQNQFPPKSANLTTHPTPRFVTHSSQPPQNKPIPLMFRPLLNSRASTPDKIKLNRSFSWEPGNNTKPPLRQSPLLRFQQPSPSSDNNNNKVFSEAQQRVERAVTAKDWQEVYLCYVESKQANDRTVQGSDLRMFRNVIVKDIPTIGSNFSEFVDFIHKEKGSVKSSHSDSGTPNTFDQYDIEFIGSLGVSLMEKCLVIKKFDKGYEILHTLHAHTLSYFDCGKNFGAYTRDIPPSAVAIIAVKLCMGMSQENSLLGAVEVLRAINYAMPEDNITPDNMEYRIKVLQQLFTQLFDQGNISEAYEILQHLNASPNVMVPLYVKILNHYSSVQDFDQSFGVLDEMKENGFDLNIRSIQSLYEKFLKLCLTNEQDDEALTALEEMEVKGIMLNGDVWQGILNQDISTTNDILANMMFQRCLNLGVYSETFFRDTPWLCQLGCRYSRLEMKLLIVRHLKQLHQYLLQNVHGNLSLSTVKKFQITLFPRVSGSNQKFNGGIQTAINKNSLLVAKVLQEDLNPPLMISGQAKEQFHSKFIVEAMSLYRWFNANEIEGDGDDAASSNGSIGSCMSYMTRMTEFD